MPASTKISSGVQQLVDRLHKEGVAAGQREASQIVEKARRHAAQIVATAKKEADEYRAEARAEIEREKEAALAAAQMAVRDTVIELRASLAARFRAQVQRLVTAELCDQEFLRRLILEIAGRSLPEKASRQAMEILVSDQAGVDRLVLDISAEMLRDGIEIKPADDSTPGIRARLVGEDMEIDLTGAAISEALLRHILPRFRYLVQGIQESD